MTIEFVKTVNVEYCSVEVEYLDKLYAEILTLREALEFYANNEHYIKMHLASGVDYRGDIARKALAKAGE